MSTKPGWEEPEPTSPNPVLPLATEAVILRAGRLTAHEIARLDAADHTGATTRTIAWDLLRDAFDGDPVCRGQRLAARNRAWEHVNSAAISVGLKPIVDDGYWRVVPQPAAGAARLACFAACALLAPELLEPEVVRALVGPWRSIVG